MRILTILLCAFLVSCSGKSEFPAMPAPTLGVNPMQLDNKPLAKTTDKKIKKTEKITDEIATHDEVISQLYNASMVFTLPEIANINDNVRGQLIIDPSKTVDELTKDIDKNIRAKDSIKVSKILIAKLIAPDFIVTPITPEEQALTRTEPTIWLWNLDPKEAGIFTADLVVTAVVKIDDQATVHNIKTFSKELKIEIKPEQVIESWLEKYWQWLTTSFIAPVVVWLYKKRKKESEPT